jgi:rSAM/selenodomain-associated transferase 2
MSTTCAGKNCHFAGTVSVGFKSVRNARKKTMRGMCNGVIWSCPDCSYNTQYWRFPENREVFEMKVSAIVPTLNEEASLPRLLEDLRKQGAEIIVVDGGSSDQTVAIAHRFEARVKVVPAGRGRQLNAGAKLAGGEALFFVHADSLIPSDAITAVAEILSSGRFVGGAFSIAANSSRPSIQFIYRAANWRSRRLLLPYGDQGIFALASAFQALGGYREIPLMEDIDFVRRLKRLGSTVILPQAIITSIRRLEQEGVVYGTLRNMALAALFLMGGSPHVLQKYYPHVR